MNAVPTPFGSTTPRLLPFLPSFHLLLAILNLARLVCYVIDGLKKKKNDVVSNSLFFFLFIGTKRNDRRSSLTMENETIRSD